jgi:hypothetical protein
MISKAPSLKIPPDASTRIAFFHANPNKASEQAVSAAGKNVIVE